MRQIRLAAFMLKNYAAYAHWSAGAEMCGGEVLRQRSRIYRQLTVETLDALKAGWRLA